MRCGLSFAFIVVATISAAVPAGAGNWLTYYNDRYGTTVDYPDVFKAQPPPDANDGRAFKSADGATFAVYASYNALDFDLAKYRDFIMKNLDSGEVVTYQTSRNSWFVISGTNGAKIFYERHLLSHAGQMMESFVMSYPASLKQTYDPIVTRMAKSLRSGTGFQTPRGFDLRRSIDESKRPRHLFERLAFGRDPPQRFDHRGADHQRGAGDVADSDGSA